LRTVVGAANAVSMTAGRWLAVLAFALGATTLLLRTGYVAVRVDGVSMEPTLRPGDRVLVRRMRPHRLRRGQVVVFAHPGGDTPYLVKRAVALPGDPVPPLPGLAGSRVPAGSLVVLGDNPHASFDSRQAGYFAADTLLGVVVRRLR
jgi:signal peptidase I